MQGGAKQSSSKHTDHGNNTNRDINGRHIRNISTGSSSSCTNTDKSNNNGTNTSRSNDSNTSTKNDSFRRQWIKELCI